ncbi:MAG: hypothetical protein AAFV43_03675 [Planctomycetota bacterium]
MRTSKIRSRIKPLAIAMVAMFAALFVLESTAEARRYRRVHRPVVVVRTPVVGVRVAPRRFAPVVRVGRPRVGVFIGF